MLSLCNSIVDNRDIDKSQKEWGKYMVILGLGSNVGDRLANLRKGLNLIRAIPQTSVAQVSPIYISDALLPENAPTHWDNRPYLNAALRCDTKLEPYEFLKIIKNIEIAVGRKPDSDWAPRPLDIDILAWDDLVQYDKLLHIPHEHLLTRPFALWPLADVAPNWIHPRGDRAAKMAQDLKSKPDPLNTKQIPHRIDTAQLVGTINLAPDSFSDGGQTVTFEKIKKLADAGADVIDIGAEATNPNAKPITPEEEWRRLEPFLSNLKSIPAKISLDTRNAKTAEKALALGIDWINDVSGLTNPAMQELIRAHTCDVVMMHHVTIPASKDHVLPEDQDVVKLVYQWGEQQLEKLNIPRERIIFDVGIGFGKTAQQSLDLLKNIEVFKSLGCRLLVGHSRKSFLELFTQKPPQERDLETVLFSLHLNQKGVDYLRVHDVDYHARAFRAFSLAS